MSDNEPQPELTGLERFSHLEDKIYRVVDAFNAIRRENETLRVENQRLKNENDQLQRNSASYSDNMNQLLKEREALRERVEKALGLLATLEVR
jgi:FtsZ-binding cell division protein ZapB